MDSMVLFAISGIFIVLAVIFAMCQQAALAVILVLLAGIGWVAGGFVEEAKLKDSREEVMQSACRQGEVIVHGRCAPSRKSAR